LYEILNYPLHSRFDVCWPASPSFAGEPLSVTGVLFVNSARLIQDPVLPITIDGLTPVAGHPWYEPRISAGTQPPPALPASIEVISEIAPSNFVRPPGRIIPSPYDEATTFSFSPIDKQSFDYLSRWPELFTPRDGRNTVVLALVNRARSLLFNTNFDLDYSLDQEIIGEPTGLQTTMIRVTARAENETIVIRLRAEATDDADSQFVDGSAVPPASSQTPTSVIGVWRILPSAKHSPSPFRGKSAISLLQRQCAISLHSSSPAHSLPSWWETRSGTPSAFRRNLFRSASVQ